MSGAVVLAGLNWNAAIAARKTVALADYAPVEAFNAEGAPTMLISTDRPLPADLADTSRFEALTVLDLRR